MGICKDTAFCHRQDTLNRKNWAAGGLFIISSNLNPFSCYKHPTRFMAFSPDVNSGLPFAVTNLGCIWRQRPSPELCHVLQSISCLWTAPFEMGKTLEVAGLWVSDLQQRPGWEVLEAAMPWELQAWLQPDQEITREWGNWKIPFNASTGQPSCALICPFPHSFWQCL